MQQIETTLSKDEGFPALYFPGGLIGIVARRQWYFCATARVSRVMLDNEVSERASKRNDEEDELVIRFCRDPARTRFRPDAICFTSAKKKKRRVFWRQWHAIYTAWHKKSIWIFNFFFFFFRRNQRKSQRKTFFDFCPQSIDSIGSFSFFFLIFLFNKKFKNCDV